MRRKYSCLSLIHIYALNLGQDRAENQVDKGGLDIQQQRLELDRVDGLGSLEDLMNGNGRHQGGVLQQADEGVTQGGHGHQGGLGDDDPAHGLPLVQTQSPARLILALGDGAQGCTDDLGVIDVYKRQHIHNELEQWYIMLPGASFTYTAEDEKIHVEGGDITFTPHGSHHGSECAEGERFAYVWFEL